MCLGAEKNDRINRFQLVGWLVILKPVICEFGHTVSFFWGTLGSLLMGERKRKRKQWLFSFLRKHKKYDLWESTKTKTYLIFF